MVDSTKKKFTTIACCGLDCCLCPSFQSNSASKCPGCMGPDFNLKHPPCGILTCCVKKKGFETCAECSEMPCDKLKGWDKGDSFISHKRSLLNLQNIKEEGMESFLIQQKQRQNLLELLLAKFNDGRSKSFYCTATALLPINDIEQLQIIADNKESQKSNDSINTSMKERSTFMKNLIQSMADKSKIDLKLRKS
jgi:hypothetical protein